MPRKPKDPLKELAEFQNRTLASIGDAMTELAFSIIVKDRSRRSTAMHNLGNLMSSNQGLVDLMGRKRMLMEADFIAAQIKKSGRVMFELFEAPPASTEQNIIPKLPFEEAIDDLIKREPRLASAGEEIAKIYTQDHGFALAKLSNQTLSIRTENLLSNLAKTFEIKNALIRDLREGRDSAETIDIIQLLTDSTRAYAQTVYRTNMATAYDRGREAQIRSSPEVRKMVPALEFLATGDAATRPNHQAAHRLVADVDDPVWKYLRAPLGFNCRCIRRPVSIIELERRNMVNQDGTIKRASKPPLAFADPGFTPGGMNF